MAAVSAFLQSKLQEEPTDNGVSPFLQNVISADEQPEVSTSPIPVPEAPGPIDIEADPLTVSEAGIQQVSNRNLLAAKAGVKFDDPIAFGHALASFGIDEKEHLKAYQMANPDKEVRIGPETGQIEWLSTDENGEQRWAEANPDGFQFAADIPGFAADAAIITTEILGSIAGFTAGTFTAGVGGAVAGVIPGEITGAAIGKVAALYYGESRGLNQDMTWQDAAEAGAKEAGMAVLGGAVFKTAMKAVNAFALIADGVRFDVGDKTVIKDLVQLGVPEKDAPDLIADVNELILAKGEKYQATMGQESNNPYILNAEAEINKKFKTESEVSRRERESALSSAMDVLDSKYEAKIGPEETVFELNLATGKVGKNKLAAVDKDIRTYRAKVSSELEDIDARPDDFAENVRANAEQQITNLKSKAGLVVENINKAVGNAAFISPARTARLASTRKTEIKNTLIPYLRGRREKLFGAVPDKTEGELSIQLQEAIRTSNVELKEQTLNEFQALAGDAMAKLFNPDAKLTLKEMWSTRSALQAEIRAAQSGIVSDTPSVGDMNALVSTLTKDIQESMLKSDAKIGQFPVSHVWDKFRSWYRAENVRFERDNIVKLLRKDGASGEYKMSPDTIEKIIMVKGDGKPMKNFMGLIKSDAQLMTGLKKVLGDFYTTKVDPNLTGTVNLNQHARFFDDRLGYGKALKQVFTPKEIEGLKRPGVFQRKLKEADERREKLVELINKDPELNADITDITDVDQLRGILLNPSQPEKAKKLMTFIRADKDILKAVQYDMATNLRGQWSSSTAEGNVLNAKAFNDFLNKQTGKQNILSNVEEVMGKEYVDNAKKIMKLVAINERKGTAEEQARLGEQLAAIAGRAYFGMFTTPGRVITAAAKLKGRAANKLLMESLFNPEKARELAGLAEMSIKSERVARYLGIMGANSLQDGYFDQPDDEEVLPRGA